MISRALRGGAVLALAAVVVVRIVTRQNRGEPQLFQPEPEPHAPRVPGRAGVVMAQPQQHPDRHGDDTDAEAEEQAAQQQQQ